jgi:hypothetical protein
VAWNPNIITFRLVSKRFGVLIMLLLAIPFFLGGCASENTAASGDPVPGEKVSDEGRVQPGAGPTGPNASVKF